MPILPYEFEFGWSLYWYKVFTVQPSIFIVLMSRLMLEIMSDQILKVPKICVFFITINNFFSYCRAIDISNLLV